MDDSVYSEYSWAVTVDPAFLTWKIETSSTPVCTMLKIFLDFILQTIWYNKNYLAFSLYLV